MARKCRIKFDKHFEKTNFRVVETEIWDLVNGGNNIISPTLPHIKYSHGVCIYLVPIDFCSKR